ncbi:MAG: hypothetical protein K0S82_1606 [Gaiellaceae bacterium]|jgi:hypothetical protein|nr:hypothetical protein [Gaiellaceae bacterium]
MASTTTTTETFVLVEEYEYAFTDDEWATS